MEFSSYPAALSFFEDAARYGIVPGLASVRRLCARLGNPQERLRIVHVAGTNGKGSVTAYLTSILKTEGYPVGTFNSPALSDYRERILYRGRMLSQKDFTRLAGLVETACGEIVSEGHPHPTQFEMDVALGFLYFREKGCDPVILECGMGGEEDATNLIERPLLSVLTSVSMDHQKFLGRSLAQIAEKKAGIIKEGRPVYTCAQKDEALRVIRKRAKEKHAPLFVAEREEISHIRRGRGTLRFDVPDFPKLTISLAGLYQIENAQLALHAALYLKTEGYALDDRALYRGFLDTRWAGRFERINKKPTVILDGAHNEDAAKRLAESLKFYFTNTRLVFIIGVLRDKAYDRLLAETLPLTDAVITVKPPYNPRALDALSLANAARETAEGLLAEGENGLLESGEREALQRLRITAVDSVEEAAETALMLAGEDDVIVCFGSLSYLAPMRRAFLSCSRKKEAKESRLP